MNKLIIILLLVSLANQSSGLALNEQRVLTECSGPLCASKEATYIWRYGGPYGVYCGLGHTSKTLDEPIDNIDRQCQIHDTCVSAAGYLDCFCNEQLRAKITEECPNCLPIKNGKTKSIRNTFACDAAYYRDQIIRAMDIGTGFCDNLCDLRNRYAISAEVGFNAIPFYEVGLYQIDPINKSLDNIYKMVLTRGNVLKFGRDNLRDPSKAFNDWNSYMSPIEVGDVVMVNPSEALVVYRFVNSTSIEPIFVHVK